MIRFPTLRGAAACLAAALFCANAEAQLFRAYLTSDGSDANPCTLQAPCRLLPAALNAVADGGEIWMLDSANYNTATVNINKSVSILAVPGVVGSLVALNGGSAVTISADGLDVALRNLVIGPVAGVAPGAFGVWMTGASHLTIEDSLFANLPNDGVFVVGVGTLKVANTTFRNHGNFAIQLLNGAAATVSTTRMLDTGGAVGAFGSSESTTTTASISDSVISGRVVGLRTRTSAAGAVARISVTRSTIERTTYALWPATTGVGTAEINVGSSLIVDNAYAWYQEGTGSTILSLGNNQMRGNTSSFGVLTPLTPQ